MHFIVVILVINYLSALYRPQAAVVTFMFHQYRYILTVLSIFIVCITLYNIYMPNFKKI